MEHRDSPPVIKAVVNTVFNRRPPPPDKQQDEDEERSAEKTTKLGKGRGEASSRLGKNLRGKMDNVARGIERKVNESGCIPQRGVIILVNV